MSGSKRLTGAQIVMERLKAHNVDTVFGYPGGAVLTLYDELYKNSDSINHILTAHEQGAAHAADGYARASGRTGVVIATSGPGATNLVTGIANAYLDSVPVVAITGNVPVPLLGRNSFQEVDIVGITRSIVKKNWLVTDVSQLEDVLDEAFLTARSGRCGPVLIDIPKNVQSEVCEYIGKPIGNTRKPSFGDFRRKFRRTSSTLLARHKALLRQVSLPDKIFARNSLERRFRVLPVSAPVTPQCRDLRIAEIAAAIEKSERPFIYAGGGVIAANACPLLRELCERLSAPAALSMSGLTALPADYPFNLGMSGMHGQYAASVAKSESDLLIALGVRFSDRATGDTAQYAEGKTIVHVDIDSAELGKNVPPCISVCADVGEFLAELLTAVKQKSNPQWLERVRTLKREQESHQDPPESEPAFSPRNIIKTVEQRFCGGDSVIATDVGQHQMWVTQYYGFCNPRTLLTSGGLGAMGFGLGAAIGGCIAAGGKKTVLFTGDGSFGMNLIELATAVSQGLPIVTVILNNSALGLPRQWQTCFYEKRYSHSSLENRKTDFAELARAFGARGYSADNLSQLERALSECDENFSAGLAVPAVIDCKISKDEFVLPMIPPGGSVKDIITKYGG